MIERENKYPKLNTKILEGKQKNGEEHKISLSLLKKRREEASPSLSFTQIFFLSRAQTYT